MVAGWGPLKPHPGKGIERQQTTGGCGSKKVFCIGFQKSPAIGVGGLESLEGAGRPLGAREPGGWGGGSWARGQLNNGQGGPKRMYAK